MRHYNTVIRPVNLYGTESFRLLKIGKRIYRLKKTKEGYKLGSNQEIYENLYDLESAIRERRLNFYGHMGKMDQKIINKPIFYKNMEVQRSDSVRPTN